MTHSPAPSPIEDQDSCALNEGITSLARNNRIEILALLLALAGVSIAGNCGLNSKIDGTTANAVDALIKVSG